MNLRETTTEGSSLLRYSRRSWRRFFPTFNVHPEGDDDCEDELDSTPRKEASGTQPLIEEVKVGKGAGKEVMPDLTGLSMRNALEPYRGEGD